MNSVKVLLSAFAGLAAGAALGILFAPDKGSSTRKKISRQGSDYADGLSDKFNAFIDNMTQKFEGLKEEATEMAENGKAKAREVVADIKYSADGNSKMKELSK